MMKNIKSAICVATSSLMWLLASCEKPQGPDSPDPDDGTRTVFTGTITSLKTSVSIEGNVGKVSWNKGDEITITDADGNSAVYEASSDGASVEFTLSEGETAVGDGPYTATYNGETPELKQTYVAGAAPSLTMTASSSTTELTFSVTSGLLRLELSGTAVNIKEIMVKGDNTELYTLSCADAVDISSAKEFFVALPAGEFKKIYLTDAAGKTSIASPKNDGNFAIEANTVQPVELTGLTADKFDGIYLGTSADSGYPLLWAEKNLGATTVQETGAYLSWGNTGLTWLNGVKTDGSSEMSVENYKNTTGYDLGADISPDSGNDAARVNMGGSWRLPTTTEASALVKLTVSYVAGFGYTIEGNGNSIFVPVASFIKDSKKQTSNNAGEYSYFWTNHFIKYDETKAGYAHAIQLRPDGSHKVYEGTAYYGFNIRGVKE